MPLVALLDADVLFPETLRDTLLRLAAEGCFRLHWSLEILDEARRNLVRQGRMSPERAKRLVEVMSAAFPDAMVNDFSHLVDQMPCHAKDRHVAAAALHVGAQVIVTSNVRDFAHVPPGLTASTPERFLSDLLAADATGVLAALRRQSAALRNPPISELGILDRLERFAPTFAARARIAFVDLSGGRGGAPKA
jgi:hypothetical protein